MLTEPNDPRHGTPNGYTNHNCHCAKCKAAWSAYTAERRARRVGSPNTPHGTASGYSNWGCRCPECVEAKGVARSQAQVHERANEVVRLTLHEELPVAEIAARLGYKDNSSVYYILKTRGIMPYRRKKPQPTIEFQMLKWNRFRMRERNDLIKVVRKQGFTLDEIGAELGITRERVRQVIRDDL